MSEQAAESGTPESHDATDTGSYEVLKNRLARAAAELSERAASLNARRKELFGGRELAVVANIRVRTENNCVPRDVAALGGRLLLGFNVFIGMKAEPEIGDVFSLHELSESAGEWEAKELELANVDYLNDQSFKREFAELFAYYKAARLSQLRTPDGRLLAVFQIGGDPDDVRVFRWARDPSGRLSYLDNRGERDHVFSASHDFDWQPATREMQVTGRFPHISILDELFVETTHGSLTLKVENNTESGAGIYQEPVDDPNQSLDDADIAFAKLGTLILLKVRPFGEALHRYIVFNSRTQKALRIDAIGEACIQLPEDHGIIFPGGYCLRDGEHKLFEGETQDLRFLRVLRSPNGEDVLYTFYRKLDGHYLLLSYNLIDKRVDRPLACHGYCLLDDGKLVVFSAASDEPARVHAMQIWQTPFVSREHAARAPRAAGYLGKVGNADLVRGISDAFSIARLANQSSPNRQTFEDLLAFVTRAVDSYYWLGHAEAADLATPLATLRQTAEAIIDEFEKVQAIRARAAAALETAAADQEKLLRGLSASELSDAESYMRGLSQIRAQRGQLITLRELRYIDLERLGALEQAASQAYDEISVACVEFLQGQTALKPLILRLDELVKRIEACERSTDIEPLAADLGQVGSGIDLLAEVVGGLTVGDAGARAAILEGIGEVYGHLNRVRAVLKNRQNDVLSREGRAEFAAQFKLFSQSVTGALAQADTPDKCDELLSRLSVQLEEIEGRFGEFEEFAADLASKREEVYDALSARKQALLDDRQRRASALLAAAARIFDGIGRRAKGFKTEDDLNGYFASDAMVLKLRELGERLRQLDDNVHAEELETRLKTARQDALRALRDNLDLFEGDGQQIRLGRHRFAVNTQSLELTLVPRDGSLWFHLNGTDFYAPVEDGEFAKTREFWERPLISESERMYRAEYLAGLILETALREQGPELPALRRAAASGDELLAEVRRFSSDRYDEGYERGVHDADAAKILERLLAMSQTAGLLRYGPGPRAVAALYYASLKGKPERERLERRGRNLARLFASFADVEPITEFGRQLEAPLGEFSNSLHQEFSAADVADAAGYLARELSAESPRFVVSADAENLQRALNANLERRGARAGLDDDLRSLDAGVAQRFELAEHWLSAYFRRGDDALGLPPQELARLQHAVPEAAACLATQGLLDRQSSAATTQASVGGLLGRHPRIKEGKLELVLFEFLARFREFSSNDVPAYTEYKRQRAELSERERERLRLDEFKPRILSSFVRNQLIDQVYLPLIGDNLAKQIGASGESKRTDHMGLLLVVSPPGYGKTTLMEYVANRLGLVFMKVNGPALGHGVTSFDPDEAPNATARQEIDKINLAFEMGNNVMLYLDDIQHTHPELLQKFISLCDAQRRVEGVWRGRTRTYDLRGKRFCVVMAGNPYTESGERFQIPDMLANRADTYNLGEVLEGKDALFAQSYLENCLTSNSVLNAVAARSQADVHHFMRVARGEEVADGELEHDYSATEAQEIVGVLRKLFVVQAVLLAVNQAYIHSASQEEAYRSEPPFKLQGSYRNMNKLAEKVVSAMNEAELQALIDDHYAGESQTLTSGAEQNLLKLSELRGRMSDEQRQRWQAIKAEYQRLKSLGGKDDDPVTRVTGTLSALGRQLDGIKSTLAEAAQASLNRPNGDEAAPAWLGPGLEKLERALAALAKPELEVKVATLPGLDELLNRQLALVERTLIPLIHTTNTRAGDARAVQAQVEQLMRQLAEVLALMQRVDQRLGGGG